MILNDMMEFDHVIRVDENGNVTDEYGIYGPSLFDDELDSSEWSLLDGYSGQDGYSGPIMHNSEFIGGQMERDILAQPGLYVVVVAYWSEDDYGSTEDDIEGWAVAYREA